MVALIFVTLLAGIITTDDAVAPLLVETQDVVQLRQLDAIRVEFVECVIKRANLVGGQSVDVIIRAAP